MLNSVWCNVERQPNPSKQLQYIDKEEVVFMEKMDTGHVDGRGTKIYMRDGRTIVCEELIDTVCKLLGFAYPI